jgi:spermidine/putrescine transport system ATP-binding protein
VNSLVELQSVSLSYGPVEVLHAIDLAVMNGEFLVVLGPSGSGKTTILRLIGGFLQPTKGRIVLDGADIAHVSINRRPFNTVFQDYALFPHMTAEENVAYGLKVRGVNRSEIRARVRKTLSLVALDDFADRHPAQLSGGQQQRIALARAIICEPRLVLLDEPLGALDAELRRQMQRFLKELQREIRTTFLFITHDQEEAVTMADRICVMRAGRIEQVGTPSDVYYRPANEYVARFFGDNNVIPGSIRTDGGQYALVETPFGSFSGAQAPDARTGGSSAILVVRPEAIQITPSNAIPNRARARVRAIDFVGPITQIFVNPVNSTGQMPPLMIKLASSVDGPALAVGDEVEIGWRSDDAHIVAT